MLKFEEGLVGTLQAMKNYKVCRIKNRQLIDEKFFLHSTSYLLHGSFLSFSRYHSLLALSLDYSSLLCFFVNFTKITYSLSKGLLAQVFHLMDPSILRYRCSHLKEFSRILWSKKMRYVSFFQISLWPPLVKKRNYLQFHVFFLIIWSRHLSLSLCYLNKLFSHCLFWCFGKVTSATSVLLRRP
jgi:hypothetical protein